MEEFNMTWAVISLVGLVGAIALSNWKKINVGVCGLAFAFVIGTLGGMKLKAIYSNFNTQIFLRMFGMQCLIVIARSNGTLKIIANAILSLCKGKAVRVLPIMLFVLVGLSNWFNMGIAGIMQPLVCALAFEMGFKNPLTLFFVCMANTVSWMISPYSMVGLDCIGHASTWGIEFNPWNAGVSQLICGTVFFLVNYFYFGWHKMAPVELSERPKVKFEKNNILTLLGFAAFIILNIFFKVDLMITPICAAVILMSLGVANPRECIKSIPFNTLMMLGGMSVYVGVIKGLGGVELLSTWITSLVTERTAVSAFALIAALMSVFASANSVVIPTLVAIIPTVTAMLPGVTGQALLGVTAAASNGTGISPMSTTGGNMLGYYSACYNPTDEEQQKVFNYFLIETGLVIAIYLIMPLFGVWNINLFH